MNALLFSTLLIVSGPARAAAAEDSALERIHSEEAASRERACAELARAPARGPRVYPALVYAMDQDLSERVRLAAAEALITFPGDDALKSAQRFLQSEPGEQNRIALTVALSTEPSRIDDAGVTDLISTMLFDDPNAEERRAAALGLARRGDAKALPALRRAAAGDADKRVREAARQAVQFLSRHRPPSPKPAAPKAKSPAPGAVKGKDSCPEPWAWCECDGPIKRPPKCLKHAECRIEIDTLIQLGMPCTWNGLSLGAPQ